MRKLSKLQNFILRKSLLNTETKKSVFAGFYKDKKVKPRDIEKIITSSINKLIKRNLLIAYCKKTKEKIFIERVTLTPKGKRLA